MNGFTHALPFLDNAYFSVGCCLPDWLSICDRKCRVREKHALEFVDHPDPIDSAIAKGVVQHHRDDAWFHATPTFNRLMLEFAAELRNMYGDEHSMRPRFVGHILVELLLDAYLSSQHPGQMERFYQQVAELDHVRVQTVVNYFATRPTKRLAPEIERFTKVRYWFDYSSDAGVIFRINQVLKRVRLTPLDERAIDWMPTARKRVNGCAAELLAAYPLPV